MNFLNKLKLEKKIGFILLISLFSYFFIIARNKYETVAQISIKTSGDNRELSFQSFLNGVSGSSSKEDSRFLKVYLRLYRVLVFLFYLLFILNIGFAQAIYYMIKKFFSYF